jgi:hypothetical protein
MKIKINEELKNINGESIIQGGLSPMTLRDVCITSILSPIQEDDQKKKYEKYEIFKKLRDAKEEVILMTEEIAVIKNAIGKLQPPLIMGQCFELLEK